MRAALVLATASVALAPAAEAGAAPVVHAHRGGSSVHGAPAYPENTLAAFRAAAALPRVVLEMDSKLTADDVPVVIHDATLDRTTTCSGAVAARTLAQLAGCPTDVLGSPGSALPARPTEIREPVPTLVQALELARDAGVEVNLEIKNQPTDSDFDVTGAFAARVLDAVVASGFPPERLIVQSFWPPNLEVARARLPAARLSLLTLSQMNAAAPEYARLARYPIISPAWPVDAAFVGRAHGYGQQVVPYTLNSPAAVGAAAAAGVDAVITDDPAMALRVLGLERPDSRRCEAVVRLARLRRGERYRRVRAYGRRGRVEATLDARRRLVRLTLDEGAQTVRLVLRTSRGRLVRLSRTVAACGGVG